MFSFPDSTPRRPKRYSFWRLFAVVVTVLVLAWWFLWPETPEKAAARLEAQKRVADLEQQLREQQASAAHGAGQQRERLAQAKAKQRSLHSLGERSLEKLLLVEQEAKATEGLLAALLTNDDGRCIAQSATLLSTFRTLKDSKRHDMNDAVQIRTELEELLRPVKLALAEEQSQYVPSDSLTDQLQRIDAKVAEMLKAQRLLARDLEQLLRLARKAGQPALTTLADALERTVASEQEARAASIREREEAARKQADEEMAKARADMVRAEGEAQAKRLAAEAKAKELAAKAEADAKRVQAEIEAAERRIALERERLKELARRPDVRSILQPFITKGTWQPGGREIASEPVPVSLSKLRAYGALEDSPEGLKKLLECGSSNQGRGTPDKLRPKWACGFDPRKLSIAQREHLILAQRYLRDLGDVMVEMGMLSP